MENKYFRTSVDLNEAFEWEMLSFTSCFKEEFRMAAAEKEISSSYMHAAEVLHQHLNKENNPIPKMKIFTNKSLTVPMLYLCRHALELAMKIAIEGKEQTLTKGHRLAELWTQIKEKQYINDNQYDELISLFEIIDDDGAKLRYAKNNKGNEYKDKACFVKVDLIIQDVKALHSVLMKLAK